MLSSGSETVVIQYALQKRRQRINERLRILQSLIPNGTKVSVLYCLVDLFLVCFWSNIADEHLITLSGRHQHDA